jgi:hypothetical protein
MRVSWVAEHHHHRARSFIGPPSSPVSHAWHVSVISRPPAACRLIFPNTRLIITHRQSSPPSTTIATTEEQGTSPALHYYHHYRPPYYDLRPFCPHRRQLVVPACHSPQPTAHSPPRPQSTRPALRLHYYTKPAHYLRPDSFRLPDHRPLFPQPPHRIHRTDLLHRSPATAGPRILFFPHPYLTRSLPLVHHSFHSSAACFIFPSPSLPSHACDLVVVSAAIHFALAAHQTSPV